MSDLKKTLATLLAQARAAAPQIYNSKEFRTSNLPLNGQIFIKLTNSAPFRKEEKILTDEGRRLMTEGARQIALTIEDEFYRELEVDNEYQAKALSALQERAMYPHEFVDALGLHVYGLNTAESILACLKAKGKIKQREDFKYEAV